jgi:murein DD-endopeptidase MepM/ murein hydrolase activator NlpD
MTAFARILALGPVLGALAGCFASGGTAPATSPPCTRAVDQRGPAYVLPFPPGRAYRLTQGNCSAGSHNPASPYRYSFDFAMPIGDTVVAARAGTVVQAEDSFADGTRLAGKENELVVEHSDGTFGRYTHLMQRGSVVRVGDRVLQGQPIGQSGDSGNSRGPHLHFDVALCPEAHCGTVPVTFRNADAGQVVLLPGVVYRALGAQVNPGR